MHSEQTGDSISKVAATIPQEAAKKKKRKHKKPKPPTTTNSTDQENVSSTNNNTNALNPDGSVVVKKKKKKRNKKKKPTSSTDEKTENLISATFKSSKSDGSGNSSSGENTLNDLNDIKSTQNTTSVAKDKNTKSGLPQSSPRKTFLNAIVNAGKTIKNNNQKNQQNNNNAKNPLNNSNKKLNTSDKKQVPQVTNRKQQPLNSLNNSESSQNPKTGGQINQEEISPTNLKSTAAENNVEQKKKKGKEAKTKLTPNTKKVPSTGAAHNQAEILTSSSTVPQLDSAMEVQSDKSRDEVLAAREAKRLAKQQAKKQPKNNAANATNSAKDESANVHPNKGANTKPKENALNANTVDSIKTQQNNVEILISDDQTKSTKSREEILAEREAKKLAKQAAKNKNKTKASNDEQKAENVNDTATISNKSQEMKPASIGDEGKVEEIVQKVQNLEITTSEGVKVAQIATPEGEKKQQTTKAERRALQEAQREAKAKLLAEKQQNQAKSAPTSKGEPQKKEPQAKTTTTTLENQKSEKNGTSSSSSPYKPRPFKVKFFNQLESKVEEQNLFVNNPHIHPSMVKLGEQYAKRIVVGSNSRCIAFMSALKEVVQDYVTPPKKEFSRGLEASIKNCVDHLQKCRPLAVSVSNAYKYIKVVLTKLPPNQPESELKEYLVELIDNYVKDQIEKAAQAISYNVQDSINHGDVILTYGCSSLIYHILEEAHRREIDFRVIVVDSRPFNEGQEFLRRLVSKGISCTCVLINALGFIMPEVTKVLLGAHALLANGYVVSRIGTAQVALVARSFNVSVFVCCEKHKFCERTQTDAIVYNELGNPNDLISKTKECRLADWKTFPFLYPLNLNYDVTPPELVNVVVTEVTLMPSTSAPVILRIRPNELIY